MNREYLWQVLDGLDDRHIAAAARFDPEGEETLRERSTDMKTNNRHIRRAAVIALAAALILALGATAYAALDGAEWFKSWFSDQVGEELTEGQKTYIEGAAAGIGQSVTADGWTVTLDSAISDGRYFYLKLSIRPSDGSGADEVPVLRGELTSADPDAPEDLFSGGAQNMVLGEENGVITQLLGVSVLPSLRGHDMDLSYPLTLTLDSEGEDAPGGAPWIFTFTLSPAQTDQWELVTEPLTAAGTIIKDKYGVDREEADVTVTSVKLSSMGAVLAYRYEGEVVPNVSEQDLRVETANSGAAKITRCYGDWDEKAHILLLDLQFAAPIDLDEVTAVTFQGHELALPEK